MAKDGGSRLVRQVSGVDFGGAADAGRRIWIAGETAEGGGLRLRTCRPAEELPGLGRDGGRCLAALRALVRAQAGSAFGFDGPFGLPAPLLADGSWEAFARSFARRYPDPDAFRAACLKAASGREPRGMTDRESHTPLSPYNLRVYSQACFGIRDLLAPLATGGTARILPMQRALRGKAWVLEVCPAPLLKREGPYVP